MNLSELQDKEIVDISTGRRIGEIIDVVINSKGEILKLIIEDKKISKRFFKNDKDNNYINWDRIIKIGDDIILIDSNNNIN